MISLAWKNVLRRKNRVLALCIITMITIMVFTTVWSVFSVIHSGMEMSNERFGADVVICPKEMSGDDKDILYTGSTDMVYMEKKSVEEALPQNMIDQYTEQFYVQTLPDADCCSTGVVYRITGIDTDTDFIISSWLEKENLSTLKNDEMITGTGYLAQPGDSMKLLGEVFKVKGTLYKTGTALDSALYVDIEKAREVGAEKFPKETFNGKSVDSVISSCLIKLKDGYSADEFENAFNAAGVKDVKVVTVSEARAGLMQQIKSLFLVLGCFVVLFFIVAFIALYSQYSTLIKERKKETGYLRAIGMTRKQIVLVSLYEVLIQAVFSGLLGGILGCLLFRPIYNQLVQLFATASGEWGLMSWISHIIGAIAISLIVSLCSACIPAVSNAKVEPHQALMEGELM